MTYIYLTAKNGDPATVRIGCSDAGDGDEVDIWLRVGDHEVALALTTSGVLHLQAALMAAYGDAAHNARAKK